MKQALHGFPVDSAITRTVVLSLFILMLFVSLMAPPGICMSIRDPKDSISNLSFSHDGKKVVFDRCRNEGCQIQVYDLETGELAAYQSPENERWTMGKYSYDGKRITFSVIPVNFTGRLDLGQMQIAVMDADGKNYKKVTTGHGAKLYPTFSHNGKKILYACGAYIREKGGTPAAQYDAWEVDPGTGEQKQLTFFKYFYMSNLTYFPDDERFIYYSEKPEVFNGLDWHKNVELFKKHMNESEAEGKNIYGVVVMNSKALIKNPYVFPEKTFPQKPLLSKDGSVMIYEKSLSSGKFFLFSPDGNHKLVCQAGSVSSAAISPDGKLLGVIAANVGIHIFLVNDGSHKERIYVPTPRSKGFDYNRLPKYKVLSEQPSWIINR